MFLQAIASSIAVINNIVEHSAISSHQSPMLMNLVNIGTYPNLLQVILADN